eukprot:TRINITY_DN2461_c2_g1_i1.p1 TRINITY_DN2461_c2_g1~~TRINITY_DN2461_c2_g1_i1.p1  ORF type:complete len:246 (+),score=80.60 TRINITY_DN2461_c2_g1_i1:64-738(+)
MAGGKAGIVQQPAHPRGLCVFDIDATLTRSAKADPVVCRADANPAPLDATPVCRSCVGRVPEYKRRQAGADSLPATFGKQAVQQCLANGFAVGVATARSCNGSTLNARLGWMQQMGLPQDVVSAAGGPGQAVGCAPFASASNKLNKSKSITRLIKHYKVTPQQTIFFDDSAAALGAAKKAIPGLHTQLASSNCGGTWCSQSCGLTKTEFHKGFSKVHGHHHHHR